MSLPIRNPQSTIRNRPGGYTLVELLVVMIIMVILVATALPLVKRVMDNDRVREGSRSLSAFVNMAKTRATQTGRPIGLLLELEPPLGVIDPAATVPTGPVVRQCTKLFLAEVPPTFAGSTQGARARIRESVNFATGSNVYEFYPIYLDTTVTPNEYKPDLVEIAFLYTLIDEGEVFLVRFEHKGAWYKCRRGIATDANYIDPDVLYYLGRTTMDGSPNLLPGTAGFVGYSSTPLPPGIMDTATPSSNPGYYYHIMRAPKPVGDPLELTGGTCIDLNYSGMGLAGNTSRLGPDPDPDGFNFGLPRIALGIVFSPSGGIKELYGDGVGPQMPNGTLHFLLGRVAKMDDPTADNDTDGIPNMFEVEHSNLADATSLWVSIGRANGTVTTSENVPDPAWTDYTVTGAKNFLGLARSIATGREQMGGQ